jgi:hypothetical protein
VLVTLSPPRIAAAVYLPAVGFLTVTVVVQDPVFPFASVASHVTVVLPTWNWDPEFGLQRISTGATAPLTVGAAKFTGCVGAPFAVFVAVTGAIVGQLMMSGEREPAEGNCVGGGGVVGVLVDAFTTTPDEHEAFCCAPSTAVHVNDVVPTGKSDPDGGEHVVDTGVTPPVTVGVTVTAIALPSSDVITGDGQAIVGPVDVGTRPETSDERCPTALSLSYDCTTK